MSDFLKFISLLEQELKAAQQDLQVRTSFSSQKLAAVCIECSEAQWDKSAGGVALPVRICCEFIIGKEREDSGNICPSEFYVVKKGESQ